MKSKTIKKRNIPDYPPKIYSLKVKPYGLLVFMCLIGIIMLVYRNYFSYLGIVVLASAVFCILVLPNRTLVEFTDQYLIMHNCLDKEECRLLYWDEILSWQYIWGANHDYLEVEMVNHSIQSVEVYNKSHVVENMRLFARDKEKIVVKGKKAKANG